MSAADQSQVATVPLRFAGKPPLLLAVAPPVARAAARSLQAGDSSPETLFSTAGPDGVGRYWSQLRWQEHLLGRLAGRAAVSGCLQLLGVPVAPADVVIERTPSGPEAGRPVVSGSLSATGCNLSITHANGMAAAVACVGARVGVDMELLSPRSPEFAETAFTAQERAWLQQYATACERPSEHLWTLGWCIKEALVKILGQGLRVGLNDVACRSWLDGPAPGVQIRHVTGSPGAIARLVRLDTAGVGLDPVAGLIAVGPRYALAALCQ